MPLNIVAPRFWYKKNYWSWLLLPCAFVYRFACSLRYYYYHRLTKPAKFAVPIIVVGNITVGGTGKTPLVIWLAKFLQTQGYKPGIISRGYGGKIRLPQLITVDMDARYVGDEPLLMARQVKCPIVVAPRRVAAVEKLLQDFDCDIVISDDGLQHYALARDIEIVVADNKRLFGNGYCLPAGPLREPLARLAQVDFIVKNGAAENTSHEYAMQLIPAKFHNVLNPQLTVDATFFSSAVVHAIAGIGNPARFFQTLREQGLNVIEHPYPDHYYFKACDFAFPQATAIIMSEKDAVKCATIATENCWYLPVTAQLSEAFSAELLQKLRAKIAIKNIRCR